MTSGLTPPPMQAGPTGRLYIVSLAGGRRVYAGLIGQWKIVLSPTTKLPTLIATAHPLLCWLRHPPRSALAVLEPVQPKQRIGRPKPARLPPVALRGTVTTWRAGQIILSEGGYVETT